ncbi:MAG: 50S ribosomal protein L10 [Omnitrophica bacterium]|nr:50S ribosomal protein L10 [Candidatus Omnitrophota bacterium]
MEEKFGISTKKYMLAELASKAQDMPDFVITNYNGLSSQEMEKLRRELNMVSSKYCVVKNAIAKRTFRELEIPDFDQLFKGEIGIGFAGDIIKASKTLVGFAKKYKALKLRGALIDGKFEDVSRVEYLAALPSKEALFGMVASYMKSPITGFVGVLSGLLRNFVCAVNEIKKKRS